MKQAVRRERVFDREIGTITSIVMAFLLAGCSTLTPISVEEVGVKRRALRGFEPVPMRASDSYDGLVVSYDIVFLPFIFSYGVVLLP